MADAAPNLNPAEFDGPIDARAEMRNAEQGFVEVDDTFMEQRNEQLLTDLRELPAELQTNLDRVAPGLGAEAFARTQQLADTFTRNIQDSQTRGNPNEYGAENATVSEEREALDVGSINRMITALKMMAEQLVEQVRRQEQSPYKVFEMDKLDGGEPRAVPEFLYIVTGQKEFGSGHEVEVGGYKVEALQSQAATGPGSESRKIVIYRADQAAPTPEQVQALSQIEVTNTTPERAEVVDLTKKRVAREASKAERQE